MEAVETMILKDDAEKQIVLNRGLLIKTFSVSVYNKKTRKEKKRLFVISAVIILLIVSLVSSVAGDWTKIMENKSKIQKLNKKYNELLSEEEKLQSEVTKLQDDDYILRYAKEKFLYSENGELIIRMN